MNRQILFHETCMVIHIFPIDPVFIPVKIQLIQALLQNRVDGVVRGVRPCSGLSGNIRCHKVSPCSTRARGSMYPRPARLRLREAALHPAPLRETLLPLLAPLHAALAVGGASVASMERGARARSGFACRAWLRATNGRRSAGGASLHTPLTRRASGGQGCFQHYSTTERIQFHSLPCLKSIVYLSCSKCIICI